MDQAVTGDRLEGGRTGAALIGRRPAGHVVAPDTLNALQGLQRAYGNRAVQRLIAQRQAGEEEEVQTRPLQRADEEEEEVQTLRSPAAPRIQRVLQRPKRATVQRESGSGEDVLDPDEEEAQGPGGEPARAGGGAKSLSEGDVLETDMEEIRARNAPKQGGHVSEPDVLEPDETEGARPGKPRSAKGRERFHGLAGGIREKRAGRQSASADNVGQGLEWAKGALEPAGIASEKFWYAQDYGKRKPGEHAVPSADVASGAAGTIGMFLDMAQAVRKFREAEPEKWKQAAGILALEGTSAFAAGAASTAAVVSGGATLAHAGEAAASTAAFFSAGVSDSLGGIKSTFFTIKGLVDMVHEASGMSREEKFHAIMELVKGGLDACKSGLQAGKDFLDTFGGPNAALAASIPGLGIAIVTMDVIDRGVTLIKSAIRMSDMRKKKQEFKQQIGGKKGESSTKVAEDIVAGKVHGATEADVQAAKDYLRTKGLQYINLKRLRRAVLKISLDMTKMAGDIATLGGVSAPVGIGIKSAASAVDLGASIFRRVKQAGRNKAERAGPESRWAKVFNAQKSTKAKEAEYNRQIDWLFDKILKAEQQYEAAQAMPKKKARAEAVEVAQKAIDDMIPEIEATGMSVKAMHALRDKPDELKKKLLDALKKRE